MAGTKNPVNAIACKAHLNFHKVTVSSPVDDWKGTDNQRAFADFEVNQPKGIGVLPVWVSLYETNSEMLPLRMLMQKLTAWLASTLPELSRAMAW